ncbi:hypothetical protein ZWY2020_056851 [Hordeum vulgare]|nr:hypothetical protein ZWY2020_056851 [Hordeum vulgare]
MAPSQQASLRPSSPTTTADAESMDAELRQVVDGFDYKVLKDGGKGSKALCGSFFVGGWWDGYFHSCLASLESVALYSARSAPHERRSIPREAEMAVAATPSEVEATRSLPPPQVDSPKHRTSRVDSSEVEATRSPVHEPRVNEPQVDEPSTHETRVPEASFQATPEQRRDEGTSPETQWDTSAEPSGHAGSDEELGEGATVYQRGSSGLPLMPATREQRWSIRPNGDKGWIVAKGVCNPNSVLGVLCRQNFPGFVMLPGRERECEEDTRRTQRLSKPNVAAYFKTFRTRLGCRLFETTMPCVLGRTKKCRDSKMEKEHYMKVPPRWCVDKMDCWEALVDQWCSDTWEASHNNAKERRGKMVGVPHHQGSVNLIQFGENGRHNKTEVPQMYDMYVMAHTASYKKVKAFSESDLEHPENFTNISSHHKLVKYIDHGKARKGGL